MENVLAGFAEIDITPEQPENFELIGFNRSDNFAKGVLHRLKAQVLILQSSLEICCLATIDSIGITTELTNQLREHIANELTTSRENVMVCYSHTHAAPDAAANNGKYFRLLVPKIVVAVKNASASLFPIKAVWGIAKNTIGSNRRGSGSFDERLGVLKIAHALTSKTELLLLHITTHPNVLTSDNLFISSDYFGPTRDLLEKEFSCKVMLVQGAAGNIRSKFRQRNADMLEEQPLEAAKIQLNDVQKKEIYEESLAALAKNAEEIKKSVVAVFDHLTPKVIYRLKMWSTWQTFIADVPSNQRAQEIALEAKKEAGIDGANWLKEVARLNKAQITQQTTQREIQFLVLNKGGICGVPDEPMSEIALMIQQKSQDDLLFFGGYTNGYEGYLADEKEYDCGGYEVLWSNLIYFPYYHHVMPFNRDTAEKLSDHIAEKWRNLVKKD